MCLQELLNLRKHLSLNKPSGVGVIETSIFEKKSLINIYIYLKKLLVLKLIIYLFIYLFINIYKNILGKYKEAASVQWISNFCHRN